MEEENNIQNTSFTSFGHTPESRSHPLVPRIDLRDILRRQAANSELQSRVLPPTFLGDFREKQRNERKKIFLSELAMKPAFAWVNERGIVVTDAELYDINQDDHVPRDVLKEAMTHWGLGEISEEDVDDALRIIGVNTRKQDFFTLENYRNLFKTDLSSMEGVRIKLISPSNETIFATFPDVPRTWSAEPGAGAKNSLSRSATSSMKGRQLNPNATLPLIPSQSYRYYTLSPNQNGMDDLTSSLGSRDRPRTGSPPASRPLSRSYPSRSNTPTSPSTPLSRPSLSPTRSTTPLSPTRSSVSPSRARTPLSPNFPISVPSTPFPSSPTSLPPRPFSSILRNRPDSPTQSSSTIPHISSNFPQNISPPRDLSPPVSRPSSRQQQQHQQQQQQQQQQQKNSKISYQFEKKLPPKNRKKLPFLRVQVPDENSTKCQHD